jgi:hypothetical protein
MTSKRKKKTLAKAKEAVKEALAKAQETKPETNEAEEAPKVTDDTMKAGFRADLKKAKQAQETAKGATTAAANFMFMFFSAYFLPRASTHGTRLSVSRQRATRL